MVKDREKYEREQSFMAEEREKKEVHVLWFLAKGISTRLSSKTLLPISGQLVVMPKALSRPRTEIKHGSGSFVFV